MATTWLGENFRASGNLIGTSAAIKAALEKARADDFALESVLAADPADTKRTHIARVAADDRLHPDRAAGCGDERAVERRHVQGGPATHPDHRGDVRDRGEGQHPQPALLHQHVAALNLVEQIGRAHV